MTNTKKSLYDKNIEFRLCQKCGGTGSCTSKFPIIGCLECEGDGRIRLDEDYDMDEDDSHTK